MRCGSLAAFAAVFLLVCATSAGATAPSIGPDSNLPVPRFVSLRTAGANGRHGPSVENRVDWIYQRVGLPLEVTAESGPWRRVRDPDGAQTWMHAQNLDTRRTAYVEHNVTLRETGRDDARAVAYLAPGVVGALTGCQGDWRRIAVGGRVGWVNKSDLWGADACDGL
ncbi:MAG: aspartyl-trna synthetase [Proteobacteria bacterium]|nr:aspartyl-trna synthetase [Pseudomonadota bacterium]